MEKVNTFTNNTSVFLVVAVVRAQPPVRAVLQGGLIPSARHVVQENISGAFPKKGFDFGRDSLSAAQLPAHNRGILHVPAIIADGCPAPVVKDFEASRAHIPSLNQSQGHVLEKQKEMHGQSASEKGFPGAFIE